LRAQFSTHRGEEIDHAGDGFFVAFESVDSALDCAVAIQRDLARHRREHGFSPAVRIGVHLAEATGDAEGYSGMGVHHAARIGGEAQGDEILASQETVYAAENPRESSAARRVSLKGIAEPASVVSLAW
jgi:class 3 adenylate cyclase